METAQQRREERRAQEEKSRSKLADLDPRTDLRLQKMRAIVIGWGEQRPISTLLASLEEWLPSGDAGDYRGASMRSVTAVGYAITGSSESEELLAVRRRWAGVARTVRLSENQALFLLGLLKPETKVTS